MNGYGWVVALAAVVVAACALLVWWLRRRFTVVTVSGESMRPTLAPGDRLLVRRTPLARVQVGDVVVIANPHRHEFGPAVPDELRWMIKRAAATPGDPVPTSVLAAVPATASRAVPAGALVVLGDNAQASFDSRQCGYIAGDQLLGVVLRPFGETAAGKRIQGSDRVPPRPARDRSGGEGGVT